MTAPKPGDRVRVTYTGTVDSDGWAVMDRKLWRFPVIDDPGAQVEVLASPVYVNSDTTQYLMGDVAKHADNTVFVRHFDHWYNAATGYEALGAEAEPLTLLLRNGKPVQS